MTTPEYIYLLQEREFVRSGEETYKLGITNKIHSPKFNKNINGGVLLYLSISNNSKETKQKILSIFKENFIQKKYNGNDYFSGNYTDMIKIIQNNNFLNLR